MAELEADRRRRIESLVDEWLADADVPGASVVLVDAEGERFTAGFGARDLAENDPATPETLYGMGSISKSITALTVVRLTEAGELSLDDPVTDYTDHFEAAPGDPITVADLLSHTSGMPATSIGLLAQSFEGVPAGVADEADRVRFVREAADHRAVDRDRFMYYNTGYDVLGAVVDAVDGRPYATAVAEDVFEPLGMDDATFDADVFDASADAMTGYRPGEDGPEPAPFPFEDLIRPSGGLVASVRDMGRFLRAMMAGGTLDGERVCSSETIERLHRPRAVRQAYLDGSEEQYGYGWMRHPLGDDAALGHGGSIVVSTAYAGYLDDAGVGVVIACNTTADPHPIEVGQAILAVATGREPTDVPAYAIREKCEAVTGTYETFREGATASVERSAGGLEVEIDSPFGDATFAAFPETLDPADHTFYMVAGDGGRVPVEFRLDEEPASLFFRRNRFRRAG